MPIIVSCTVIKNANTVFLICSTKHLKVYFLTLRSFFFDELCWGKTRVAYTMPQQRKKEESERLRGERDQIKSVDLGFERWQVLRFRKARGRQDVP